MGEPTTRHEVLGAEELRLWVHEAMDLLTVARPVIDRANVFPVADADTGTNMCLTLAQGRASVDALAAGADVETVLDALAQGALLGARGNSGVILSEYLRGFAAGARSVSGEAAAAMVAAALREGAGCAYAAVGQPRQGTILTAATGAAGAADAALGRGADLAGVLEAARSGAHAALRRSADDLDVLRAAGVLDAGAYGLVLVLDALGRVLTAAEPMSAVQGSMSPMTVMTTLSVEPSARGDASAVGQAHPSRAAAHDEDRPRDLDRVVDGEFEVMYVVEKGPDDPDEDDVPLAELAGRLRAQLQEVGDSVAVVGGATARGPEGRARGLWQVHVHTDRPLDALEVGRRWTQRQVVVRSLAQQVSCATASDPTTATEEAGTRPGPAVVGVVACTASPGLVPELARAGAVVVLEASVPVVLTDLQRAVEETGAHEVLVLPADTTTADLARAWAASPVVTAERGPGRVHVVGSTSDLHVVTAMAHWATVPHGSAAHEVVAAMVAAVGAVRAVEVPAADSEGATVAVAELLAGARGAATVVTVLADELVPADVVADLARAATRLSPGIDVVVLPSGRRSTALVLGVE